MAPRPNFASYFMAARFAHEGSAIRHRMPHIFRSLN